MNDPRDPNGALSVCGIAVLYYPRTELLERLVRSTQDQLGMLYVVDNTPHTKGGPPLAESATLIYISLGENVGLAAAQNVGLRRAIQDGYTHVLLLDQDSELTEHTVELLLEAEQSLLAMGHRLAAVGAMYVDIKTNMPAPSHRYHAFRLEKVYAPVGSPPVETDWLIASGSLIRCSVLHEVGLMREELFIDAVDTEWGLRARSRGFISFLVPRVTMVHSIGDNVVQLFGRKLMVHSDLRHCYMVRNNAYLLRVATMGWRWRSYAPLNLLYSFLTSIWTAEDKIGRAKLLLGAALKGLQGQTGPFPHRR